MEDEFVTIHATYDALQADILRDVLSESGIDARVVSSRSVALFGAAADLGQSRILVPESRAEQARDVVLAHLASEAPLEDGEVPFTDEQADDGDEEDEAELASAPPRLRPLLAGGVAFLLPGGSHFYARRPWIGAMVLVGQVVAFMSLGASEGKMRGLGMVLAIGLGLFDLIGGQIGVRAFNRGQRMTPFGQLGLGSAALFGLGLLGMVLADAGITRWAFPNRKDVVETEDDRIKNQRAIRRRAEQSAVPLPAPLYIDLDRQ